MALHNRDYTCFYARQRISFTILSVVISFPSGAIFGPTHCLLVSKNDVHCTLLCPVITGLGQAH